MLIRTTEGNTKDVAITEVNATNYIVPDNEKHVYHCKIEVVKFDSNTGVRQSKPRIQKFGVKMFNTISHELKRQGYTVDILHNPTEYLKAEEARKAEEAVKIAERKAIEAEEKKATEEAARKAEIDAAVAAALAEQQKQHEADIEAAVAKAMAKAEKKAAKAEKKAKADESETNAE